MFIGDVATAKGAATKHKTVIGLQHVTKVYDLGNRKIHALTDFSLDIHTRDFVVICGPSGCGKSTLLNIITGVEEYTSGNVTVRGTNLFAMSEDKRGIFRSKKMGVIYQRPYWIRSLNCVHNVALPLIIEGCSERRAVQRAMDVLAHMRLTDLATQNPAQLSGGEQQKLAFARAIIADAHIIIADEPTGNLDSTSSDELMALFHDLHAGMKKTVIMVTHNQAYWNVGTKRVEMQDGKLVNEVMYG